MNNWIHLFFEEILDKGRIEILPNLQEIKKLWFYLAWWTWLALQFWHRESIDFDFFIPKDINTDELFLECLKIFKRFQIKKFFESKNTLYVFVNDVKISFFTYNQANILPLVNSSYFDIASIEDIWSMKLWAIQNRATNKDYVDLYFIIKKIWLDNLLKSFFIKFGEVVTKSYILKSLIYFDDITEEQLIMKDSNITFSFVKKELEKIVKDYLKRKQ